jgi:N-acyl-D-aspartate/D-glutamate deacylase
MFDYALNGGQIFDGTGAPPVTGSVAVQDGRVARVQAQAFTAAEARTLLDVRGQWVMPGFLDIHTHYDAEVEAAPSLSESLIHGSTTIFMGSCSLGAVLSDAVDVADMFTRVEAMPREHVLPLLERVKSWKTPRAYRAHLDSLGLGPNVSCFMGHSDLRCAAMGLGRSVTKDEEPTSDELETMRAWLTDGLDAGFLGLSVNTNRWDKLGGTRFRSKPLPSTYASWDELRSLIDVVRQRGGVLQGIPNISAKYDTFLFFAESIGLFRRALKTSLVSMVDVCSNRLIYKGLGLLTRIVNRIFKGDVKFQGLPVQFDLFVDGLDAPVFEELGAGTAALHLEEMAERRALLLEPGYRAWFRQQWTSALAPKVFHRDLRQSRIIACPDASLVGRSFADIARERKVHVVDAFLDLCAEHGAELRWRTVIGNDRPHAVEEIVAHPDVTPGFSDAGAHLRNMAFYNFPLQLLRLAKEGRAMSVERAVHRLTGEIADWFDLDAGKLSAGARADIAVVDPKHLDATLDDFHEAAMPEFGGCVRLVRRNPDAVPYVLVNGQLAAERGVVTHARSGRFLGAGEKAPAVARELPRAAA